MLQDIPDDVKTQIYGYVYDLVLKDLKVLVRSKFNYNHLLKQLFRETYYIRANNRCLYCLKRIRVNWYEEFFICSKDCYDNSILFDDYINYE